MNSISRAMLVAQEVADRHGCGNQWRNDYTLLRENYGILFSLQGALKNQGLWGIFTARCDREWLRSWYPDTIA